jgi:hypothetical protein
MGTLPCPALPVSRQSDSQKTAKPYMPAVERDITPEVLAVLACDMPCSAGLDPVC